MIKCLHDFPPFHFVGSGRRSCAGIRKKQQNKVDLWKGARGGFRLHLASLNAPPTAKRESPPKTTANAVSPGTKCLAKGLKKRSDSQTQARIISITPVTGIMSQLQ